MKIASLFKRRRRFQRLEIANDSDRAVAVVCEPWAHEQGLAPGGKVTIRYEVDQVDDAIETISLSASCLQIWFRTDADPQFIAPQERRRENAKP